MFWCPHDHGFETVPWMLVEWAAWFRTSATNLQVKAKRLEKKAVTSQVKVMRLQVVV